MGLDRIVSEVGAGPSTPRLKLDEVFRGSVPYSRRSSAAVGSSARPRGRGGSGPSLSRKPLRLCHGDGREARSLGRHPRVLRDPRRRIRSHSGRHAGAHDSREPIHHCDPLVGRQFGPPRGNHRDLRGVGRGPCVGCRGRPAGRRPAGHRGHQPQHPLHRNRLVTDQRRPRPPTGHEHGHRCTRDSRQRGDGDGGGLVQPDRRDGALGRPHALPLPPLRRPRQQPGLLSGRVVGDPLLVRRDVPPYGRRSIWISTRWAGADPASSYHLIPIP